MIQSKLSQEDFEARFIKGENIKKILINIGKMTRRLKAQFIGKTYDDIVEQIIVSAMAGQPFLLIGPPGGAKSMLITTFFRMLGLDDKEQGSNSKFYQYVLHSFTMPDEILGVVQIKNFIEDNRFIRYKAGALTDGSVKAAFLDEIFNANSTILNTLLSLINEREFFEGGQKNASKLFIIAGASNKVPEDMELRAFFDRFPIRLFVDMDLVEPVMDGENQEFAFVKIVDEGLNKIKRDIFRRNNVTYDQPPIDDVGTTMPTVEDFEEIYQFILCNYAFHMIDRCMQNNTKLAFQKLVEYLPMQNTCSLNGRKIVKMFLLSAASALLRYALGDTHDNIDAMCIPKIAPTDLNVFKYIWDHAHPDMIHEHMDIVETILSEIEPNGQA